MSGVLTSDLLSSVDFISAKDTLAYDTAGVKTVGELLDRIPKRYEDRRHFDAFPMQAGSGSLSLRGTVIDTRVRGFGGRKSYFEAVVLESGNGVLTSNKVTCRWFSMPWMKNILAAGHEIILFGTPKEYQGMIVMDHPDFEIESDLADGESSIHLGRIVPVYKGISGLNQRKQREHTYQALQQISPESLAPIYNVDPSYPRYEAFREVHFPENMEQTQAARRYFALEEFFILQLSVVWKRAKIRKHEGHVLGQKTGLLTSFYHNLPFDLTDAQKRSVKEILADMRSPYPMSRLLQGDVGSGKTFVAMCAMLLAVDSGVQAALMAPTQILAEQHYLTFRKWLDPLGVRVVLKTGTRQENGHSEHTGEAQIVIGTHALLYGNIEFTNLGLVIIDEQHKFGVSQRAKLIQQGVMPDVLVMTATPIPRTLTLTIYGDLDVSVLDERPAGRGKIVTVVRKKPKITAVTNFIKTQLTAGRQAYLVYPLVEESQALKASAATVEYEKWEKRLSKFKLGLLHGKIKPEEKDAVMTAFRDGELDVLVATTVIEVGVDVPNASLMIIDNAERLGLSQLHQLRGRVGRGSEQSSCVLLYQAPLSENGHKRIRALRETNDGFKIAQIDLELRGPGELLGTRQTGLMQFRIADLSRDKQLIPRVSNVAVKLMKKTPAIAEALMQRWIGGKSRYREV